VLDLLYLSFGGFNKCSLVVDDVFQIVDEFPHFSGGDPAGPFGGRIDFAISRSFSYDRNRGGR
jgi:hypothetical protein